MFIVLNFKPRCWIRNFFSVNMWVFEEQIEGRKLTEIINTDHENVKYLPGVKLPANVIAVPDLVDAAKNADLLVFVIPHQFIARTVQTLKGNIKNGAAAISLIKGINITGKKINESREHLILYDFKYLKLQNKVPLLMLND